MSQPAPGTEAADIPSRHAPVAFAATITASPQSCGATTTSSRGTSATAQTAAPESPGTGSDPEFHSAAAATGRQGHPRPDRQEGRPHPTRHGPRTTAENTTAPVSGWFSASACPSTTISRRQASTWRKRFSVLRVSGTYLTPPRASRLTFSLETLASSGSCGVGQDFPLTRGLQEPRFRRSTRLG